MSRAVRIAALALVALVIAAAWPWAPRARAQTATPPDFKVAFLGDAGLSANATAVLDLIAGEGADMAIHLGDLGYGNETDPQTAIDWDAQVTDALGADYPYFASIGNHDVGNWSTYQGLLEDRLALVPGASCAGDYGVVAACTYQGLFFILSGAGTLPNAPDDQAHIDYLTEQLAQDGSLWRICAWHKNQTAMQVGGKPNEVGWGPYEACRQGRAIIATGHEHSYQRTRTLLSTEAQTVDPEWPDADTVRVGEGSTFVFVSGLGGRSIRDQERCFPTTFPYGCNGEWASISTSTQNANHGALFIEFHVDGDPAKATGYFKEIDGDVVDTFTVFSQAPEVGGLAELPEVRSRPSLEPDGGASPPIALVAGIALAALAMGMLAAGLALAKARRRSR